MNSKPTNKGAIIKPGHPNSDGLQACYLFNDSGDSVYDWTKNKNDLSVVNASWVHDGLKCDNYNEYSLLNNTNQIINSESGTIIMKFRPLSSFDDGIIRSIFGNYIGGGSAPGSFSFAKWSNSKTYTRFSDIAGDHYIVHNINHYPNWENGVTITMQWNRNKAIYNNLNIALAINGIYQIPESYVSATSWESFIVKNIAFGNDYNNITYHSNCIVIYLFIYNKILPELKIKSIYNNPYDMFFTPSIPSGIKISYANGPFNRKETIKLNKNHDHAQNLVAAYPFKKINQLSYSYNQDYSTQNNVLGIQDTAINSEGIYCGSDADYAYLNNANEPLNIDEGTIVLEFTNDVTQTLQCLFGRYAVSGAGDFTMMKYSDGNFYFLLNDGTGDHYVYINLSKIPNWDSAGLIYTQIAVLWRRTSAIWNSDNMVINIDGVHTSPDGQLNETSWNTGSLASVSYYIGNNSADPTQFASGPIRRCYLYDTVLTEAQLLSIKDNPYEMFER